MSGFRERQLTTARERINPGDILLCYLVRLSRWCGALEVKSPAFTDLSPIFSDPDPFIVRFNVNPLVLLDLEQSPPMLDPAVWNNLEETKGIIKGSRGWGINFRGSLRSISPADGNFCCNCSKNNVISNHTRLASVISVTLLLNEKCRRSLVKSKWKSRRRGRSGRIIERAGDQLEPHIAPKPDDAGVRQSIQIQAQIAEIGAKMGFRIRVPASDRPRVPSVVEPAHRSAFLEVLPLNYDENTLDTIWQIDVLWLKGRSMARAFEVEHTTAIYSGILRWPICLRYSLICNPDSTSSRLTKGARRSSGRSSALFSPFSIMDRYMKNVPSYPTTHFSLSRTRSTLAI